LRKRSEVFVRGQKKGEKVNTKKRGKATTLGDWKRKDKQPEGECNGLASSKLEKTQGIEKRDEPGRGEIAVERKEGNAEWLRVDVQERRLKQRDKTGVTGVLGQKIGKNNRENRPKLSVLIERKVSEEAIRGPRNKRSIRNYSVL